MHTVVMYYVYMSSTFLSEMEVLYVIIAVQSQDTDQVMQQEREAWKRENATLCAELEQLKGRGLSSPVGIVGRDSPLEQHAKSSSPTSDDEDLEMSMIKVLIKGELGQLLLVFISLGG